MNDPREKAESGVAPGAVATSHPGHGTAAADRQGRLRRGVAGRNQTTGGLRPSRSSRLRGIAAVDPAGREIVSLSRLEETVRVRDPNLVTIHHVGTTADYLFYIMDPAVTSPVRRRRAVWNTHRRHWRSVGLRSCGRRRLCTLVETILSALACLHQEGLVHRDVKPSNCLFIGGELKLADFGLLTEADRAVSRIGTLSYMPPDGVMDTRATSMLRAGDLRDDHRIARQPLPGVAVAGQSHFG